MGVFEFCVEGIDGWYGKVVVFCEGDFGVEGGDQCGEEGDGFGEMEGVDGGGDGDCFFEEAAVCLFVGFLGAEGWVHEDGVGCE